MVSELSLVGGSLGFDLFDSPSAGNDIHIKPKSYKLKLLRELVVFKALFSR